MTLSTDDRLEIRETIALHGHLVDAGAHERLVEVFTPDLALDVTGLGLAPVQIADKSRALEVYIAAGQRQGSGSTVAMHATNIIVREDDEGAKAWSKGLTVDTSGSVSSFTYEDHLVRTNEGWRIRQRRISARQEPGSGPEPGHRAPGP